MLNIIINKRWAHLLVLYIGIHLLLVGGAQFNRCSIISLLCDLSESNLILLQFYQNLSYMVQQQQFFYAIQCADKNLKDTKHSAENRVNFHFPRIFSQRFPISCLKSSQTVVCSNHFNQKL